MNLATPLVLLLLVGCNATEVGTKPLAYTLVHLKTGPTKPATQEESKRIFAGHFANMGRLAREGHLVLAGPYGKERHDPLLRGIFVLGTGDRSDATRLAQTDPGYQAGVFVLEYHDLVTDAPLRAVVAKELAIEDQAAREGRPPEPGAGGRSYVLLTAKDGAAATAALRGHRGVLLLGQLDGTGAFAILDAKAPGDVANLLGPALQAAGDYVLDGWFAGGQLAHVAEFAAR